MARPLTQEQLAELFDFDARQQIARRLAMDCPESGQRLIELVTTMRTTAAERIQREYLAAA